MRTRTRTNSAKEISNSIDLLTEILIRVPVKPLGRFKCVSKQWLSLSSDPQFSLSHTRHHHEPTTLLLKEDRHSLSEMVPLKQDTIPKVPSFRFLETSGFHIDQSCNGLLLCSFHQFERKVRPLCSYYICNPNMKQFKSVSFPSFDFQISVLSVCMAFDPLKSIHYKLICVRSRTVKRIEKYQMDIYSSETDSWSPLEITYSFPSRMNSAKPVFCNGIVHWFIERETSLYFDVNRECLNTMPMPDLAQLLVLYFGESRGHLHLIVTKQKPCTLQFDVLEMAADYSGWFVRYHVNP